jgi:predicted metal-binding protein
LTVNRQARPNKARGRLRPDHEPVMDRENADLRSSDSTPAEPPHPKLPEGRLPEGPVIVSVCTTCKTADGTTVVGPDMFAAVSAAFGSDDPNVVVRPVQCLSVCKRPATVAVTSADGYTFLFGDLQTDSGTQALTSFVKSYRKSGYGLVPWRERAEVLRKGMLARVPPMQWSPDDGRAPK